MRSLWEYRINLSIISVILLVFVLPLMIIYHPEDVWCFTSRMYYGVQVFVIHLALTIWFFRLGLSIRKSKGVETGRGTRIALVLLCVAIFVGKNFLKYHVDQWIIYNHMSLHIGGYLSEMLTYRLPIILQGMIFFVIGIFVSVRDEKLLGCGLKQLGWVLPLLFLIGCCASEWLYFKDRFYSMIVSTLTIFTLIETVLVAYRLTAGNAFDNFVKKHNKFFDFLVYLYPSAICIYVFKVYSIPIFVLFYLGTMWLIYKCIGKIKIGYERKN